MRRSAGAPAGGDEDRIMPSSATHPTPRCGYLLRVCSPRSEDVTLRLYDLRRDTVFLTWRGAVAKQLLRSKAAPCDCPGTSGFFPLSKADVKRLTLAAAAISLSRDGHSSGDTGAVHDGGGSARRQRPGLHVYVSEAILAQPGYHPALDDVVHVLLCRFPTLDRGQVEACLEDLVQWRIVQRVTVDAEHVFFDADTKPHLHVFDPATRTLHDAPREGVLRASVRPGDAVAVTAGA
jgi:hypothetical protein